MSMLCSKSWKFNREKIHLFNRTYRMMSSEVHINDDDMDYGKGRFLNFMEIRVLYRV
jgi:hypothetical protein